MELLICPICEKKGLIGTSTRKVDQKRVVCENEHIIHFRIGQVDFLAKTEQAILEEMIPEPALN